LSPIPIDEYYDIEAVGLPTAFCIVWCWFPHEERPDEPGPTLRPGIVRRAQKMEIEVEGKRLLVGRIEVVYGTKQIDKFPPPRGFHVDTDEEKRALGLINDTVFQLDNVRTLMWTRRFFGPDKNGKLIDKSLNSEMRHRIHAQWLAWLEKSKSRVRA
jgi:hypothetical protein